MRLSIDQADADKSGRALQPGSLVELRPPCRPVKPQSGFTLVELITVMVIIGVLAVAALPRFVNRSAYDSRAFYDQLIATLRYAQKSAIAQHRFVCVTFGVDISLSHGTTTGCTSGALAGPGGQAPIKVPYGVTLSGAGSFYFDALGVPSGGQSITVSPYATPIIVEAGTGYVH
jgi:MSHA pilin protein MshC